MSKLMVSDGDRLKKNVFLFTSIKDTTVMSTSSATAFCSCVFSVATKSDKLLVIPFNNPDSKTCDERSMSLPFCNKDFTAVVERRTVCASVGTMVLATTVAWEIICKEETRILEPASQKTE